MPTVTVLRTNKSKCRMEIDSNNHGNNNLQMKKLQISNTLTTKLQIINNMRPIIKADIPFHSKYVDLL